MILCREGLKKNEQSHQGNTTYDIDYLCALYPDNELNQVHKSEILGSPGNGPAKVTDTSVYLMEKEEVMIKDSKINRNKNIKPLLRGITNR